MTLSIPQSREETPVTTLTERILKRIEELDTNPSRVSELAGLSRSAIRDIVSGKSSSPSLATLEALCGPLQCTIGYLVGAEDSKPVSASTYKFWMIHGIGQRPPAVKHWSESLATMEALRLAKANPGITFVVLEATAAFRSEPNVVELSLEVSPDDIPF